MTEFESCGEPQFGRVSPVNKSRPQIVNLCESQTTVLGSDMLTRDRSYGTLTRNSSGARGLYTECV